MSTEEDQSKYHLGNIEEEEVLMKFGKNPETGETKKSRTGRDDGEDEIGGH